MIPKVTLIRQSDYNIAALRTALDNLIAPLGGWDEFLFSGAKVILKVNFVTPSKRSKNVLTDPAVVEALIQVCQDNKCEVRVCDSPAIASVKSVAKSNGVWDVCEKYGVKLWDFKTVDPVSVNGKVWKICKERDWADRIINIPKLKGHGQVYYTGAVKNHFGFVIGKQKFFYHMLIGNKDLHFARMLLQIAKEVGSNLHIIDGIGAMAGEGPVSGKAVDLGLLGASKDPLALDMAVVKFLSGDISRIPYFLAAKEDPFWDPSLSPEVEWAGASFIPDRFYFPSRLKPIRFSVLHAVKSIIKSLLNIVFKK